MQFGERSPIWQATVEERLEKGLATFIEVGTALLEIRDSRLYREQYRTFEDYCRERWQMSRIHAHRLIDAAVVTENLLPMGNILPDSERQARPLTKLEPDQISYLRGKRYNGEKRAHGGTGANQYTEQKGQNDPSATADRLADEYKVAPKTIKRDGQFASAVDRLDHQQPVRPPQSAS